MPNRILRNWTASDKINGITVYAERFFTRLIMTVDDYGCFHADARLLKANLFPLLLDSIREADLLRWMAECQKAGLIVLYECDSKKYLQIRDFRQRLDKAKSRYPLPTDIEFPEVVTEFPAESETEVETEKEKKSNGAVAPISFKKMGEKEFYEVIAVFADKYPKKMLREFYDYWREPSATGIMRFQLQKTWDTSLRLKTWQSRNNVFGQKADDGQPPKNTAREAKDADLLNQIDS